MQEEFLWHIWKFRLFDSRNLQTTGGEVLQIIKTGEHNRDAGPDFFNARIKIGKTVWAGNVEMHLRASDWKKHFHEKNRAFDNIILHIVYEADAKLFRKNGEEIPALELKNRIPQNIYGKYLRFKASRDWIPCGKQISSVEKFTLNNWLDRLLVERLERKSKAITESLKQNKNNWEETFYQFLARNFGQKINSEPFELFARALPVSVLAKHKNSLSQIEALLFGVAGMLSPTPTLPAREGAGKQHDEYFLELQKEFKFLKQKFNLKSIDSSLWKFMRLHPPNFPTIRISQFANLIFRASHLFSKILEAATVEQIINLLYAETSEYWETHYRFGKTSAKRKKILGKDSIHLIIINTIVPFLFVYGKERGEEKLCERALLFLEKTDAENNSIVSKWKTAGVPAKNAYQTQALLQLKNEYCSKKRCLECAVGAKLLSPF